MAMRLIRSLRKSSSLPGEGAVLSSIDLLGEDYCVR